LAKLPHERITDLISNDQRLGRIFWFATMVDAAIHREWLVNVAKRPALERIAHFFCEMYHRLRIVELTDGLSYDLPMTQTDLAEALGLTSVHVNRMLREIAERKLATFRARRVTIFDLERLEAVSEFDPTYLSLEPRTA
jgi:CRP-like cAMP-binding protein